MFQELEKRTNVKLKWDVLPSDPNVMKTRIAAGTDLPDIFTIPGDVDVMQLISGKLLLRVDQLVDKYGPNLKKFYAQNPDVGATMKTSGGEMYTFPARVVSMRGIQFNPTAFLYRNDWLAKLGIKTPPTTIDEWHAMFTAFKTRDPNGNGQPDEVPFAGQVGSVYAFASAYGMNYISGFAPDASGKIRYSWTLPAAKAYYAEMAKWYSEGLILPNFLSVPADQMWGVMLDDRVGATFQAAASNADWLDKNNTKTKTADWRATVSPKGPTGLQGFSLYPPRFGGYVAIFSQTKVPEAAVKWIDYLFSDDGSLLTSMGVPNVHWVMKDGKPVYTDAILKPDGKWWENMKRAGIDANGVPQYMRPEFYDAVGASWSTVIKDSVATMANYVIADFPSVLSTPDESGVLRSKMADITTYTQENVSKFMIGQQSLDSFDDFVAKIKQLGIDDVLKVKQAQYDRSK